MRKLAVTVLLSVVVLFMAASHSNAQAPGTDEPWQECMSFVETSQRAEADGWRHVEIVGLDKVALVRSYNAIEPVSDYDPARVFVAVNGRNMVLVFVDSAGCIVAADAVDEATLTKLLQGRSV